MTYSPSYQIRLLALLCLDREFFLEISSFLETESFTLQVSQWLYGKIVAYFLEFKQLPTLMVIEQEYAKHDTLFLPEEGPLYKEFLELLVSGNVPESEYVKNSARKYATSRVIKTILNDSSEVIEEGSVNDLLTKIRQGTEKLAKPTVSLKDKYVFSILNLEEIYANTGGIKTGIGVIDHYVGGLFRKELTFILSDTNVGKSLLMTFIAGQILRQLRKVLYVTLEMSAARTLARFYATLSEREDAITHFDLTDASSIEKVYDYIIKLRQRYEGYFFIEEMPSGKGTIEDLDRLIDNYNRPDVLIVDYIDILKPIKRRDIRRFELEDLTIALRGLAVEKNIAVLSATQAARTAANRRIVGKEFVSEDYGKMRIADTAIGMGQTREDALRHEVVLYLTKVRNNEKDKAERYLIDFNRMQFHLVRPELLQTRGEGGD